MSRPFDARSQPLHTNISHLEPNDAFRSLFPVMREQQQGNRDVQEWTPLESNKNMTQRTVTYHWKHVVVNVSTNIAQRHTFAQTVYIIVIKHTQTDVNAKQISTPVSGRSQLVYHRLDLLPVDGMCTHLKQLASTDTSALFLSASSFRLPFDHLADTETKQMVKNYLAYLRYDDLIGDPDGAQQRIHRDARKDVAVMSQINEHWVQQYKYSGLDDYIVRRYMATLTGAVYMFPGTLLNKHYDASKRDWFRRALHLPDKITFTAPYLDSGGAGYIVTMSYAIFGARFAHLCYLLSYIT